MPADAKMNSSSSFVKNSFKMEEARKKKEEKEREIKNKYVNKTWGQHESFLEYSDWKLAMRNSGSKEFLRLAVCESSFKVEEARKKKRKENDYLNKSWDQNQ